MWNAGAWSRIGENDPDWLPLPGLSTPACARRQV
jgi:hypothetical protein